MKEQQHEQQLRESLSTIRQKNQVYSLLLVLTWMAFLYRTEQDASLPLSRFMTAVFAIFIMRWHFSTNNNAALPLERYKAETILREAAQNNDVKLLERAFRALHKEGIHGVNRLSVVSGKNALHFAVEGMASDALNVCMLIGGDVNSADRIGNTPVHLAIEKIIQGEKDGYKILFIMINRETPGIEKEQLPKDLTRMFNYHVNPLLKNNNGHTIVDLLEKVGDHTTADYQKAYYILRYLSEIYGRRQQRQQDVSPKPQPQLRLIG